MPVFSLNTAYCFFAFFWHNELAAEFPMSWHFACFSYLFFSGWGTLATKVLDPVPWDAYGMLKGS
jgi:hypothetical protein